MVPSLTTCRTRWAAARTGSAVRATAFWSAVALPFAVIGLLAFGVPLSWVGFLLACNAVALVAGHGHRTETETARADA